MNCVTPSHLPRYHLNPISPCASYADNKRRFQCYRCTVFPSQSIHIILKDKITSIIDLNILLTSQCTKSQFQKWPFTVMKVTKFSLWVMRHSAPHCLLYSLVHRGGRVFTESRICCSVTDCSEIKGHVSTVQEAT